MAIQKDVKGFVRLAVLGAEFNCESGQVARMVRRHKIPVQPVPSGPSSFAPSVTEENANRLRAFHAAKKAQVASAANGERASTSSDQRDVFDRLDELERRSLATGARLAELARDFGVLEERIKVLYDKLGGLL